MKKILRSIVVLGALLVSTTVGTLGYFSASVSATNNLIQTGTLAVNVATTAPGSGNLGYWVNVGGVQVANFPAMTNAAPGVPFYFYVAVANGGTLPFDYRAEVAPYGGVSNTCPNGWYDTSDVCQPSLSPAVVDVTNVYRFSGEPDNCESDPECLDLYTWLTVNNSYNMLGSVVFMNNPTQPFGHPDTVSNGSYTLPAQNDYSIYRVQVTLDPDATTNAYQNMRFRYTLNVAAKQTNAPTF